MPNVAVAVVGLKIVCRLVLGPPDVGASIEFTKPVNTWRLAAELVESGNPEISVNEIEIDFCDIEVVNIWAPESEKETNNPRPSTVSAASSV